MSVPVILQQLFKHQILSSYIVGPVLDIQLRKRKKYLTEYSISVEIS